jgi:glycosyltransferase involved in cell wall biosynthesis
MLNEPVSVVVPCFNEEATVVGVVEELSAALKAAGVRREIIVVDDGSTDATPLRLSRSGLPDKVIRHRLNRGYGAAIKAGIRAASHERVLIVDADGQHSPDSVLALLEECEDCDMVIGARRGQKSHRWRVPGKMLLRVVCEMLVGERIPDINSGLRLVRRSEALRHIHLCSDQFSFSTSITLAFLSDRLAVRYVPVDVRPRLGGESRIRLTTGLATFMLILRTIGTFNPLKVFMPPAILFFLTGMFMLVWGLLIRNISDIAVLCLLTSFLLFCFGLLADQLALLRREINKS